MSILHLMTHNMVLPPAYWSVLTATVAESRKAYDAALETGRYFIDKYQAAAHERGHRAAAAQLRKQGVPLEVAYRIFFGKELPR